MSGDAAYGGLQALKMRMLIWFAEPGDKNRTYGDVMESVDVPDSKSGAFAGVWVRVPPSPPTEFAFVMELVDIPD